MANTYLEYTMTINKIKRPIVYKDQDAIYVLLVRLLLLDPGTNQAYPSMGVGLLSRYRYSFANKLGSLLEEYKQQISTYLPGLETVDVHGEVRDKSLILKVTVDNNIIYPISIDMNTMKLIDL